MSNQRTAIQKLIEWCKQNAFNIEDQSGVKYVVIDYEEMKLLFPQLEENEKQQIINAVNYATPYYEYQFDQQTGMITIISGENYYNQTYGGGQ
mgnify:CR=1 FL=1